MTESRWTTLDRVTRLDPGEGAEAIRNVPNTLAIFDSHFPRFHVLPGVLILGSLGELAGRLLEEETGRRWRLARAEKISYRRWAQPGDQMALAVTLTERSDDEAVLSGDVKVDGRVITRARALRMAPAS